MRRTFQKVKPYSNILGVIQNNADLIKFHYSQKSIKKTPKLMETVYTKYI